MLLHGSVHYMTVMRFVSAVVYRKCHVFFFLHIFYWITSSVWLRACVCVWEQSDFECVTANCQRILLYSNVAFIGPSELLFHDYDYHHHRQFSTIQQRRPKRTYTVDRLVVGSWQRRLKRQFIKHSFIFGKPESNSFLLFSLSLCFLCFLGINNNYRFFGSLFPSFLCTPTDLMRMHHRVYVHLPFEWRGGMSRWTRENRKLKNLFRIDLSEIIAVWALLLLFALVRVLFCLSTKIQLPLTGRSGWDERIDSVDIWFC